jgi:glycosyltransferase involved in cell wall biosynthesis
MKISVVIPAYNGEKWIAQCIENVLSQSYKDKEIIVIDDGSTDRTAEIAASYPSVKVISQTNGGLSVARNTGIAAATGDYIHFFDVDDLIGSDYYERMVDAMGTQSPDMVFGGFINEALLDFSLSYPSRLWLTTIEDKVTITNVATMSYVWRFLIRRAFVEEHQLRFIPGRLIEDMPFSLEAVACAASVVTAPGATYFYMKRKGSILNSRDKERVRKVKTDYKFACDYRSAFMKRHNLSNKVEPYQKIEYKLFGIPFVNKLMLRNGKTKWYFWRWRILQRKPIRL